MTAKKSRANDMAISRHITKLKKIILDSKFSVKQQAHILDKVLNDPELKLVVEDAGISIKSDTEKLELSSFAALTGRLVVKNNLN